MRIRQEDWSRVNWSDESSMERSSGARPEWVFRTPYGKWNANMVTGKRKSGAISQMVWACFAGAEKSPCVHLVGDPDSKRGGVWTDISAFSRQLPP